MIKDVINSIRGIIMGWFLEWATNIAPTDGADIDLLETLLPFYKREVDRCRRRYEQHKHRAKTTR